MDTGKYWGMIVEILTYLDSVISLINPYLLFVLGFMFGLLLGVMGVIFVQNLLEKIIGE